MMLSRRYFLELLAGTAAAGALRPWIALAQSGKRTLVTGLMPDLACAIDLQSLKATVVKIGFPAHSFIQMPSDADRVWAVEKWGTHAAEIDIHNGKVLRRIESPEGSLFYGHGLFWPKNNLLLISRVDIAKSEGQLAAYDHASLKQVESFIATPGALHQCHLVSDDIALVTNGGIKTGVNYPPHQGPRVEPSGLVKIDLSANRIMAKTKIADDDQSIGHFLPLGDGAIIGLSAPHMGARHGYVYFSRAGGDLERLPLEESLEQKLMGEMLSAAIDEKNGIIAVTNPGSRTILFVDARQGQIIDHIEQQGRGIIYDSSLGFLSSHIALAQIDPVSHAARTLVLKLKVNLPSFEAVSHSLLV